MEKRLDLAWVLLSLRVVIRINSVHLLVAFVKFHLHSKSLVCTVICFPNLACERFLGGWEAESSLEESGRCRLAACPARIPEALPPCSVLQSVLKEQHRCWMSGLGCLPLGLAHLQNKGLDSKNKQMLQPQSGAKAGV